MPRYFRFPVLIWRDTADFYTAALADAEGLVDIGVPVVGYAPTARDALVQVKEYLSWFYERDPHGSAPTLTACKLTRHSVIVRPEYRVEGKIFPYERSLKLPVEVVEGTHRNGMHSAAIPRLGLYFFYTQGQLEDLIKYYVQNSLSGQPPSVLSRYLDAEEVTLENVNTKVPDARESDAREVRFEALDVVAEPLGTKSFKSRFSRPYGRDAQVAELVKRLSGRGSNVLLIGERGCGKTSLLLETVRKLERSGKTTDKPRRHPRQYWVTRGARIIAGMKYLGQWEQRLEAVIDELSDIEGVLCFESLLEIIQTGGRGPEDSVASFLLPYVERGEIVLVAECTARELDSARRLLPEFVDLFGILTLLEFTAQESLSVLSEVRDQLQRKYRVQAGDAVVGECFRLHKRFLPYHAFPGKASQFMSQLFEERARENAPIDREALVARFSRQTGLPLNLLRDEDPLPVEEIEEFFRSRVIGQEQACRTVTRLVSTFKAGLNDPSRPLGVLLFCGPTGVGKTEMAKSVSKCFFGAVEEEQRLVRLDMSEYGGPGAAHRLLGTRAGPGELVKRVRRQPFTVVLLDEIEKAHPDVFDLLLGVFDEGRLTDPWGRVTTFRSAVIIMTSNLGVSALRPIGINQNKTPSYSAEVMNFFRPEFFNRIDSVVGFESLGPDEIRAITALELSALSSREGVERRGIKLRWSDQVLDHLASRGYDARYGARPLKRTIEKEVVIPLARHLVDHPELSNCFVEVEVIEGNVTLI